MEKENLIIFQGFTVVFYHKNKAIDDVHLWIKKFLQKIITLKCYNQEVWIVELEYPKFNHHGHDAQYFETLLILPDNYNVYDYIQYSKKFIDYEKVIEFKFTEDYSLFNNVVVKGVSQFKVINIGNISKHSIKIMNFYQKINSYFDK